MALMVFYFFMTLKMLHLLLVFRKEYPLLMFFQIKTTKIQWAIY